MKIGHISDIHWLDTTGAKVTDFFNKRISGGINLLAGRAKTHSRQTAQCALKTLVEQGCEHLVITGDLTNLALPGEFAGVKTMLNQYFRDEQMTIVPGNHDFYTRESAKAKRFESMIYTAAPGNVDVEVSGTWPFVRCVNNVAFIGLCSAQPRPWFVAAGKLGQTQLDDLKKVLEHPSVRDCVKIVALHHHLFQVNMASGESLRCLEDREQLLDICRQYGVQLVMHGHNHLYFIKQIENLIIAETGSCSICRYHHENKAGKFNLYTVEDKAITQIETWRFDNDAFSLWKTWTPQELPSV